MVELENLPRTLKLEGESVMGNGVFLLPQCVSPQTPANYEQKISNSIVKKTRGHENKTKQNPHVSFLIRFKTGSRVLEQRWYVGMF